MKDHERHISRQFDSELQALSSAFLALGGAVERQVSEALNALMEADSAQAEQVRSYRPQIQQMREQIDEACLRILARRQPTASDLRLVISICKAVIDLERIGEEAGKIAKRAIALAEEGAAPRGYIEVRHIGGQVTQMVREALDAFARLDGKQALVIIERDKTIDREYKSALRELLTYMMEDPRGISRVFSIIWTLRSLERIGDYARNIARLVHYLLHEGEASNGNRP